MVDYDGEAWWRILLQVRGSVFPRLLVRVLLAASMGVVAVIVYEATQFHISAVAHGLIGVALGLLLVFRTNASYDRFWEGRRLVGQLVIGARNLVRQAVGSSPADRAVDQLVLRRLVLAYLHLAIQKLREEDDLDALSDWLTPPERSALAAASDRPSIVAAWIGSQIVRLYGTSDTHAELRVGRADDQLAAMVGAVAGCERIRFTPVPFAYAQHIKVFLTLFCATAPFAMIEGMLWWTPVASGVLAFALFGIDEIGVEIEDPFGNDPNDLPLEDIAESLAKSTGEILRVRRPSQRPRTNEERRRRNLQSGPRLRPN